MEIRVLVKSVRDVDARLAVVVADEAAVVAQFTAFPKVWPERRCIGLGNRVLVESVRDADARLAVVVADEAAVVAQFTAFPRCGLRGGA